MKLSNPLTGWSFDCLTDSGNKPPAGGLALQNLRHDGHNFAKDVRVVGLWIETQSVDAAGKATATAPSKTYYSLDSMTFVVSEVAILEPKAMSNHATGANFQYLRESDEALSFSVYFQKGVNSVAYGVGAKFDAPTLLKGITNCEHLGLSVEQIFLFSAYGNSPKHEPSGGLSAARFHPMTKYVFTPNPAFDDKQSGTRVAGIRFDYRLQLFLDRHYDVATNASLAQIGNQAGVFADNDSSLSTGVVALGSGIWNITKPNTVATAMTRGAFDAVEKPLVLELHTLGLGKGFPKFAAPKAAPSKTVRCWDNVHWWGAKGPGKPLISTPGAFHCAHLHWRWGGAAWAAGVGSDPVFNPATWPAGLLPNPAKGMWGPLLDPNIWIQTLHVAVAKNDPKLDPNRGVAPGAMSKAIWETLFDPGLRSTPQDISAGEDIVLWYAAEVHSEATLLSGSGGSPPTYKSKPKGTVFIHGIFFAHDAEKPGGTVGSTDPAYRPMDETAIRSGKSWFRSAN